MFYDNKSLFFIRSLLSIRNSKPYSVPMCCWIMDQPHKLKVTRRMLWVSKGLVLFDCKYSTNWLVLHRTLLSTRYVSLYFFLYGRDVLCLCDDDVLRCFCAIGTKRGNEFPCPAGTYNNRTGLERVHDCVPCITGHYCPQGTTNPIKCPRGTFNDVLGAKVSSKLCCPGLSQKPCGFQRSPHQQIILRCNILYCSKANAMIKI